ncbi:Permease of the drug/metabolite transporter (DMT) superfamily [Myxococcus hansupus]|uniref:Permease of the drug/metabolite transporter (DMT) superfamily n=1 Tax=Pseudomyxococcus hansupus TaxID=1297742 RepID=A0A0H4WZY0_9BACT|nr:hypothetical protein [Myxococcus hansupus]AKQ68394.1 Permease of the drug/metabolite transporter (DMT) superfamily [Myxococcus hansupus]
MDVLAPSLLWLGVVCLYGAWWCRHMGRWPSFARAYGAVMGLGAVLVASGLVTALQGSVSLGAAVGSALAYVMAAGTVLAVLSPLARKPLWAMALLLPVGLMLGVLERAS